MVVERIEAFWSRGIVNGMLVCESRDSAGARLRG